MVPNGAAYENYPPFANNGTKTPPGGSPESAKYALGMVPADTFPAEWANYLFHGATQGITRLNADVGSIKKELNALLTNRGITPDAQLTNQILTAIDKIFITEVTTNATPSSVRNREVFFINANKITLTLPASSLGTEITILNLSEQNSTISNGNRIIAPEEVLTLIYDGTEWKIKNANLKYIINKSNPLGSIYQNASCATNPGTLLGVGSWVQITDRFLMARGSTYTACGGDSTVTLCACHLPAHCHSVDSCSISHSHTYSDPGHYHDLRVYSGCTHGISNVYAYTLPASNMCGSDGSAYRKVDCTGYQYINSATTGILLCSCTISHSHTGGNICGTCGCSFSIIPPYCAVYTWYRCA